MGNKQLQTQQQDFLAKQRSYESQLYEVKSSLLKQQQQFESAEASLITANTELEQQKKETLSFKESHEQAMKQIELLHEKIDSLQNELNKTKGVDSSELPELQEKNEELRSIIDEKDEELLRLREELRILRVSKS
eukprot:TRINITY_DN20403_c0_g1_i3.p2 TRINITY_DN20403_c0_g1~~TRINITY_DN20403_c0_g1_i3.p2  ORF type:complete len:135 (+),score=31.29 TRINITY_DN20403_c0_g1_i3:187-591(+)